MPLTEHLAGEDRRDPGEQLHVNALVAAGQIFTKPARKETEDYLTGRFG